MISYEPLFATMKKKGISTYRLNKEGISRGTIYNIKKGEGISTFTIDRLCHILDCSVNDIIEFIDTEPESNNISKEDESETDY